MGIGVSKFPPCADTSNPLNVRKAVLSRTYGETPIINDDLFYQGNKEVEPHWKNILEHTKKNWQKIFTHHETDFRMTRSPLMQVDEYLLRYPPNSRTKLIKANDTFEKHGLQQQQVGKYDVFNKCELLNQISGKESEIKDPRVIYGTTEQSKILLGRQVVPISKMLSSKVWNITNPLLYASGYTGDQIGDWCYHWENVLVLCIFLEMDFSRWDKHYSKYAIELEIFVLLHFFTLEEKYQAAVISLLRAQRGAKCFTRFGDLYSFLSKRKSGDPNTSLGNTLINMLIHIYFLFTLNLIPGRDYAMAALGDDNFIILKESSLNITKEELKSRSIKFFSELGMVPKLKIEDKLARTEFLSACFYPTKNSYFLAPKIGRWIARHGWSLTTINITEKEHMKEIAMSMERCKEMPVIGAFLKLYLKETQSTIRSKKYKQQSYKMEFSKNFVYTGAFDSWFVDRYGFGWRELNIEKHTTRFPALLKCDTLLSSLITMDLGLS
jgi:hypothetical protein